MTHGPQRPGAIKSQVKTAILDTICRDVDRPHIPNKQPLGVKHTRKLTLEWSRSRTQSSPPYSRRKKCGCLQFKLRTRSIRLEREKRTARRNLRHFVFQTWTLVEVFGGHSWRLYRNLELSDSRCWLRTHRNLHAAVWFVHHREAYSHPKHKASCRHARQLVSAFGRVPREMLLLLSLSTCCNNDKNVRRRGDLKESNINSFHHHI